MKLYSQQLWESINLRKEAGTVLLAWIIMFNCKLFPKHLVGQAVEYFRSNGDSTGLAYIAKYHHEWIGLASEIIAGGLAPLKILVGMDDPHPEQEVHEFLIEKSYKNHVESIDLREFSEDLVRFADEHICEESIDVLVWTIYNNNVQPFPLKNIQKFLEICDDPDVYWLGLRAARLTHSEIETDNIRHHNECTMRELMFFGVNRETDETGECLWSIRDLNMQIDHEIIKKYIIHPTLRVPCLFILGTEHPAIKLAANLVDLPSTLENEKMKILYLKKLEVQPKSLEDIEIIAKTVISLYFEKLSTVSAHVGVVLNTLAQIDRNSVWKAIWEVLVSPPTLPTYSKYYLKYNKIPEYAPIHVFYNNVVESLAVNYKGFSDHLDQFVSLFIEKIENHYVKCYWLPGYPLPSSQADTGAKVLVKSFLTAFKAQKLLHKLETELKEKLKSILIGLCVSKKEDIRVLCAESLINLDKNIKEKAEVIRNLAKNATMKQALIEREEKLCYIWIALLSGRALSKHRSSKSAILSISYFDNPQDILHFLPLAPHPSSTHLLEELPLKSCLKYLQNLRKLIVYIPNAFKDPEEVINFLFNILESEKLQAIREVYSKTINLITHYIQKFSITEEFLSKIVNIFKHTESTFKTTYKPRIFALLFTLLPLYPDTQSESIVFQCSCSLLYNKYLKPHEVSHNMKALESILSYYPLPAYHSRSLIAGLLHLFQTVGLSKGILSLLPLIPITVDLTPLAQVLISKAMRNDILLELLPQWIPVMSPSPIEELSLLVLRHIEAIPLLASCPVNLSIQAILQGLVATTKRGLVEDYEFEIQLSSLHKVLELPGTIEDSTILTYAVGHFVTSRDLALRTAAVQAMSYLSSFNAKACEESLQVGLLKCKEEDQVRSVMLVWNAMKVPFITNEDSDKNLVLLLSHLQIHRRQRVLSQLETFNVPDEYLMSIVLPTVNFYVLFSSVKLNYPQSFALSLSHSFKYICPRMTWERYMRLGKLYLRNIDSHERNVTRCLSNILSNLPIDLSSEQKLSLKNKMLSTMKDHAVDNRDTWKPTLRKFVISSIYHLISIQSIEDFDIELTRLLNLLSSFYQKNSEPTRESVIGSISELLNQNCPFPVIFKEFKHALDNELFAHFLSQVIFLEKGEIPSKSLPKCIEILLKYEQYACFFHIAKKIRSEDIKHLLASTKTLQQAAQGLSENTLIHPDDLISLGVSIISMQSKQEIPITLTLKESTFSIQDGAAKGVRETQKVSSNRAREMNKVFGMRLLKLGLKRCKGLVSQEVGDIALSIAQECLKSTKDEVVSGALEIIRLLEDFSSFPSVLELSEKPSYQLSSQIFKTLAVLLQRDRELVEKYTESLVNSISLSLTDPVTQIGALKLLKVLLYYKIMDSGVYDLLEIVPELLISAPQLHKQVCGIYTNFLVEYPLSDKRFAWHIDFLLKNIEHPNFNTQTAILYTLNTVFKYIPDDLLREHASFIVLTLFTFLANKPIQTEEVKGLLSSFIEKHPDLAIHNQISLWVASEDRDLQKAAFTYCLLCFSHSMFSKEQKKILLKKLMTIEGSHNYYDYISLLTRIYTKNQSRKLYSKLYSSILSALDSHCKIPLESLEILNECDDLLLQGILNSIENNSYTEGLYEVFSKCEGPRASIRISGLARKLIGRNIQDNRVIELLNGLVRLIQTDLYIPEPIFKAFIVITDISTNESIRSKSQELFTLMHNKMSQEEFISMYTTVKQGLEQARREKKQKATLLTVQNPLLAISIKLKRRLKKRLHAKSRLKVRKHTK